MTSSAALNSFLLGFSVRLEAVCTDDVKSHLHASTKNAFILPKSSAVKNPTNADNWKHIGNELPW